MKNLFDAVELNNLHLKNRLVRSATWEGIADFDGSIDENTYEIYRELAKGGVGAIITGFTSVSTNDFYFGGMMRLSDNKLIPQYKKLVEIIHVEDCAAIIQLALGAFYDKNFVEVSENNLSTENVREIIKMFVDAAIRAEICGFDGVQIHAAHFFFLSRFISPLVNHRTDEFGGSIENRAKILLEILRGIKKSAPKLHITIKINSSDFTSGGLDENESIFICKMLFNAGIDSIEVSGNGTSVGGIKAGVNEGYFADFAAKLADEVKIPVICVGGWRSRQVMEEFLNKTRVELISLSRPLIREPDFPKKLFADKNSVSKCVSCNACYKTPAHRCIFSGRRG
ncbi:MAG: NADH:flavin oxidoreductase [Selenomonadaceae bacterium]|nr:NADH:flavin oxidoreductase [Selenomonadaceae bacterium]